MSSTLRYAHVLYKVCKAKYVLLLLNQGQYSSSSNLDCFTTNPYALPSERHDGS